MAMVEYRAAVKVKFVWLCAILFWLRLDSLAKKLITVDIEANSVGK